MKKILLIIFTFICILNITGCKKDDEEENNEVVHDAALCIENNCTCQCDFCKTNHKKIETEPLPAVWTFTYNPTEGAEVTPVQLEFDLLLSSDEQTVTPGTTGKFKFKVENKKEDRIKYTIIFREDSNEYNLPIEYSIDNTTWISDLSDLVIDKEMLEKTEYVTIYWRLVFDENSDTILGGIKPTVMIKLRLSFKKIN